MASNFPSYALRVRGRMTHTVLMPRKARPHPKPERQPTYLRAWRKFRGLTLAQAVDRLKVQFEFDFSDSQLSRVEKGEQGYSQDLLEMLARVYNTQPASLLMRDPGRKDSIWTVLDALEKMAPAEQSQAIRVLEAMRRTGTEG